jgi:hypothetical protein
MSEPILTVYVVYDNPSDCPSCIVLRPQKVKSDGSIVSMSGAWWGYKDEAGRVAALGAARQTCRNLGLTQLARNPEDDPVIVETWI